MKQEHQKINEAVAIAIGLNRIEPLRRATRKGVFTEEGVRTLYCESHKGGAGEWQDIPDFAGSLDDCVQFEATLTDKQWPSYMANILADCNSFNIDVTSRYLTRASAFVRSTAFLATVTATGEEEA